ncbi:MAG: hypothetical protein K2Q22_15895 [Cytophagales bacterium]|nr:hypothetical protein [Cytophagales bacterium]
MCRIVSLLYILLNLRLSILYAYFLLAIGCVNAMAWNGEKPEYPVQLTGIQAHYHARKPVSFNIKLQPAFYWGSLGLEMEFSVGHNISFGVNTIGRLGSWDQSPISNRIRTQDAAQNGMMSELFFRFYIHDKEHKSHFAPAGFYIHANLGTNFIVYSDASLRPFSLITFTQKKEGDQNQAPSYITRPQPFFGGLGFGYQVIIFPQHLIGNIFVGTQANVSGDNKFQMSVYISPSIGWLF